MPGYSREDLPIIREHQGFCQRAAEAGGMTVAFEVVPKGDYGAGDPCMTAHWGYVFKGRAQVRYDDRPGYEELLEAGQAYHLPPGHRIVVLEDSEVVEFSPSAQS
jgi:hypothetical protein